MLRFVLVSVSHALSGRHVIEEVAMDDGRIVRVVQNRLGVLRTLVGECVTLVEVELASGTVRSATLSVEDNVRSAMSLRRKGSDVIVEWRGSQLSIDRSAIGLHGSNGKVQLFDDFETSLSPRTMRW